MAYIKVKSIKVTVKKALNYAMNDKKTQVNKKEQKDKNISNELKYVMNENKTTYTDELDEDIRATVDYDVKNNSNEIILSSGINCVADPEVAYLQFNMVYQKYPDKLKNNGGQIKQSIKAHHFIQSYKKGEIDPVTAHEIGKQLCERAFGNKHQIIISTHVDKAHVHNHIILNAVGLDGKKYYSNKASLAAMREISDELSKEHGLSIIDREANKRKRKNNFHYKEWQERQKGTSWKQKIENDIDKLVLEVDSLEELLKGLKEQGYEIKENRKHLTIRPADKERFVRTKTLGDEYTEEALIRRIQDKDKEHSFIEEKKEREFKGIQITYFNTIKSTSKGIRTGRVKSYRRYNLNKAYSLENDYYINMLANQLTYLSREKIESESELSGKLQEVNKVYKETETEMKKLLKTDKLMESINKEIENYKELASIENRTEDQETKLQISKQILNKYDIKTLGDINKIAKVYQDNKEKIETLKNDFKAARDTYNFVESVVLTYQDIKENKLENNINAINKNTKKDKEL